MTSSSSSEDEPLINRRNALLLRQNRTSSRSVILTSSDDDSPLPSWVQNHTSPFKTTQAGSGARTSAAIESNSDDSDMKEVLSPMKVFSSPLKQHSTGAKPAANGSPRVLKDSKLTGELATKVVNNSKTVDINHVEVENSSYALKENRGNIAVLFESKKASATLQRTSVRDTNASVLEPTGAVRKDDSNVEQSQASLPASSAKVEGRMPSAMVGIPAPSASMPVVLPEKLSNIKMLMELENNDNEGKILNHNAVDLSGDSGAIGRFIVQPTSDASDKSITHQVSIDLKGVIYNATIVPAATTMAIVNIGPTEAKVEAMFSEFAQLREDTRFSHMVDPGDGNGNRNLNLFRDDDDMAAVAGTAEGDHIESKRDKKEKNKLASKSSRAIATSKSKVGKSGSTSKGKGVGVKKARPKTAARKTAKAVQGRGKGKK